jgi:hypothetical protein
MINAIQICGELLSVDVLMNKTFFLTQLTMILSVINHGF